MQVSLDDQVMGKVLPGSDGTKFAHNTDVSHADAVDAPRGDHRPQCVHLLEAPPSLHCLPTITGENFLQVIH